MLLLVALTLAAPLRAKDKTVSINCAKDSIQRALDKTIADVLTLEISGVCTENVVVERDHVTFQGVDPSAEITAADPAVTGHSTLSIRDGDFITINDLAITGGFGSLEIRHSLFVTVNDTVLDGNTFAGAFVGPAARATFNNVTANGAVRGIFVDGAGNLGCFDCIASGGTIGLNVREGSQVFWSGGSATGNRGVEAEGGVDLSLQNAVLEGVPQSSPYGMVGWSINALDGASVSVSGGGLVGPVLVSTDAQVDIVDGLQGGTAAFSVSNNLRSGGTLRLRGSTAIEGSLNVNEFARALVRDAATVGDSLSCSAGGEAFCDDPIGAIGVASNCGQCPKP
jgi:hypothetical protein